MNYNRDFDRIKINENIEDNNIEINEDKIIISKKNYYCTNCNKRYHTYKYCNEPIISNGIISFYIKNFNTKLSKLLEGYIIDNLNIFNNFKKKNYTIPDTFKNINDDIKFLVVQRKNSLGYLEFIRGRYLIENDKNIIHLLQQMTPNEIKDINENDFDKLWNDLWDINNIRNKNHHKEYKTSKEKFYYLKLKKNNLLKNTKSTFKFNEWGFPKGRREPYESDMVCAIREYEEETSLQEKNYTVLDNCKPIRENLKGTNNINYAHNYYLGLLDNQNLKLRDNKEIGDIKLMNINQCLDVFRPYHKNKLKIIKNIYIIINNFLKEYNEINDDIEYL
jgi:hypothetical protein